jgi:ParB family transcriptional regulator, chromosome partitioning protein
MPEKRPALGRGLRALIPEPPPPVVVPTAPERDSRKAFELDLDLIVPNPRQPRLQIDEQRLEELTQSIRMNGVIQPILVRLAGERYEIVAGERRWRAAQRAGLMKVPVVVRDVPDSQMLQVALIENIQRDDLNPVEEAQAYRRLTDEHQMSQEAIATAVGKDRATVANYIRLLRLPVEVRNELASGVLSMGHARALVSLTDDAAQRRISREIVARGLSVRDAESLVRREAAPTVQPPPRRADPNTRAAEERLKVALGTPVRILRKGARGRIEIEFTSEQELQRLFDTLAGSN